MMSAFSSSFIVSKVILANNGLVLCNRAWDVNYGRICISLELLLYIYIITNVHVCIVLSFVIDIAICN